MTKLRAIALSGGPDSLYAASLMPPGLALIVDHGLREESRAEADQAAVQARALGHEPHVLTWHHPQSSESRKPKTQAAYRAARHRLLALACARLGVEEIWTGHQGDDQAETLLLRLAKGSGLLGLSGMASQTWLGNTRLVRPLLGLRKGEIQDRLAAQDKTRDLTPVLDPSNTSFAYPRVAYRALLARQPHLYDKLLDLAQSAGRARMSALQAAQQIPITVLEPGVVKISRALQETTRPVQRLILTACAQFCGGQAYPNVSAHLGFFDLPTGARGRASVGGGAVLIGQEDLIMRVESRAPDRVNGPERGIQAALAARAMNTHMGLWLPPGRARQGGVIVGAAPRLDDLYATQLPLPAVKH